MFKLKYILLHYSYGLNSYFCIKKSLGLTDQSQPSQNASIQLGANILAQGTERVKKENILLFFLIGEFRHSKMRKIKYNLFM